MHVQRVVLLRETLGLRLDLFLLSILATKTDVALYGVAYKVIEMLILVPSYIMITLFPTIAAAPPFSEQLRNLVQSAFTVMQFIAVPLIAVSFFSGQILQFIAGEQYEHASLALQLLMCGMALGFLQQVIGYTLVALNRQTWALFALAAVLVLNLTLNLILIPLFAIDGAAIALVGSEAASLALILVVYSRIGHLPTLHQPIKLLAAGATMLGLILATRETLGSTVSPLATLAAGGILSFGAYVLVLKQLGAVPPAATAAMSNLIGRMRHARPRSKRSRAAALPLPPGDGAARRCGARWAGRSAVDLPRAFRTSKGGVRRLRVGHHRSVARPAQVVARTVPWPAVLDLRVCGLPGLQIAAGCIQTRGRRINSPPGAHFAQRAVGFRRPACRERPRAREIA